MRALTFAIGLFLAACSVSHGGDKSRPAQPLCYVADKRKTFAVDAVSLATMRERYPKLQYSSDHLPVKLTWEPMPAGVVATSEILGRFQGREIYRVTYRSRVGEQEEFDFVLLALDDNPNRNPIELRPFFLILCGEVRWLEACAVSYAICPFGIEVEQTIKGTGVFTTQWLFRLTTSGARLMERTESGRGMESKTERYK